MAISAALRRAPWAVAARGLLAARSGSQVRPPQPHPSTRGAERTAPLSSLSAPPPSAADAHLLRVINYEISCAQLDCKKRDWAKELGRFFPFDIHDKEGTGRITLTRRDQKEKIEVEVFVPSRIYPLEQNVDQAEDQARDDNSSSHSDNGVASQYCISLMVKIHKGTASWLEIKCSSYPNELLVIESLAFGPSNDSVDSSNVEAKISNLPEELQKAFYTYLETRGISTDLTIFLHGYMINKDCHEYLSWLTKIKGLIKS